MTSSNIIQIASGKGGVGKTWLSVTLAEALAAMDRSVLLFDGDFGLANVDVQLGLSPKQDLGSVIAGRARLEEAITKYEIASTSSAGGGVRFDILAGKSGSGALSALTAPEVSRLARGVSILSDRYKHVVVDLAAGLDPSVMSLCMQGGTTLVVVTDEPTSLTDAYAFIKVLTLQSPGADLRVVVNMANDHQHALRTHAALTNACKNFLDINPPLAGFIPRDELVRDTIRRQKPMLFCHPQAKASQAVRKLASDLLLPVPKAASKPAIVTAATVNR